MTWEEFVKKYGDEDDNDMLIKKIGEDKYISFYQDGQIIIMYLYKGYESRFILAENRTPSQMEAIIEALRG
jgi:hypothetical protein